MTNVYRYPLLSDVIPVILSDDRSTVIVPMDSRITVGTVTSYEGKRFEVTQIECFAMGAVIWVRAYGKTGRVYPFPYQLAFAPEPQPSGG